MLEKLNKIIKEAKKGAEIIKNFSSEIRIISHYDADGICSAAILVKALKREGKDFHLSLVKQLSENIIKELSEERRGLIIFTDTGSGYLNSIQKYLLKNSKVIICDHHQVSDLIEDENLIHINPVIFDITENVSGSGVTYILARALNQENKDLSQLAIIGAVGDSQIESIGPDWGLFGLNKEILKEAVESNMIKVKKGLRLWGMYTRPIHKALEYSVNPYINGISESESGSVQFLKELGIKLKKEDGSWRTLADLSENEQRKLADGIIIERIRDNHPHPEWIFGDIYELLDKEGEFKDANEFATILNACGKLKMGYLGIALCLNDPNSFSRAREILENYRKEIASAINWIYENKENKKVIRETEKAIYILAGSKISEHLISNIVSIINKSKIFDSKKPIFGFADSEEGVKLSARVNDDLVKDGFNLKDIVSKAAKEFGGEGGGHSAASGATIPKGKEEEFINFIENLLQLPSEKEGDINKNENDKDINLGEEKNGESKRKIERKGVAYYLSP